MCFWCFNSSPVFNLRNAAIVVRDVCVVRVYVAR